MPKLNYVIDENDIKATKGMNDTIHSAPDPRVIIDMQQTLNNALQPIQMPQSPVQAPINANASWGKAAQG